MRIHIPTTISANSVTHRLTILIALLSTLLFSLPAHAAKIGESCQTTADCDANLQCYPTAKGPICSHLCGAGTGFRVGEPGGVCHPNKMCNRTGNCYDIKPGNNVVGTACMRGCSQQSVCDNEHGGTCKLAQDTGTSICQCTKDSDCKNGAKCNKAAFSTFGGCALTHAPKACPTNFTCKTIVRGPSICQASTGGCGNGTCESQTENCKTCPADCACQTSEQCDDKGTCVAASKCKNEICESQYGENCKTCPEDCGCPKGEACKSGLCLPLSSCGFDGCQPEKGENCETCPGDCTCKQGERCQNKACVAFNPCQKAKDCPSGQACLNGECKAITSCKNNTCDVENGENCHTCPDDCGCPSGFVCEDLRCQPNQRCGNGKCEPDNNENCDSCKQDCACASGTICLQGVCTTEQPQTKEPTPGEPNNTVPDTTTQPEPTPQAPPGTLGGACINGKCQPDLECLPIEGGRKTVCLEKRGGCLGCNSQSTQHVPFFALLLALLLFRKRRQT